MDSALKEQIISRMKSKDLSISSLERKAGLKRGVINNILRGSSKNPTTETLVAIANLLECSLDELVNRNNKIYKNINHFSSSKNDTIWDMKFFTLTLELVDKILKDKKILISADQIISLTMEIYKYSLGKSEEKIDKNFAEWLISKL